MKKKILGTIAKITGLLALCTLFASFSPSLDGRAVVAEDGEYPEGLFAKTVGYLPGDTLCVTNISGNETVEILVIGALDPSEGVAIKLTPEAAKAVGIERGSNNIVKITKRSGQDERVYGTAVIARTEDKDAVEEMTAEETPAEEKAEELVFEEAADETETAEETAEETSDEEAEEDDSEEDDSEEFENEFDDEEFSDEETEEFAEEEEDSEEFETSYEDDFSSVKENETQAQEDDYLSEDDTEEFEEESAEEETAESEETEPASEYVPEESFYEEPVNEEVKKDEAESFEDDGPGELSEEAVKEEVFEEELPAEEQEDETYDAIVLVPADVNPPVSEPEETPVGESDNTESEEAEVINVEVTKVSEVEPVAAPVEEKTVETKEVVSYKKYIVPTLKELKSGSYYIQIAVYKDEANILEIVNKYGKNYPITIVPMSAGRGNQVMIGPLSVDEYGTVLARFKSFGFKDCFLRKIK